MSCNKCRTTTNVNCGCNPKPCQEQDCECPVLGMTSDCVTFTEDLPCSGIQAGQTQTETIVQLDAFICEKFDQQNAYFTLVNTGNGAEVYKGVNGQGQKLIRKINSSDDLINVTQNTDDISIGIDEAELNTFIEANQKLTVVSNAGTTGETLVKTAVVTGDTTTYPIKRVIHSAQDGSGESVVRDLQSNTDDLTLRTKKLNSTTLTITSTDEEVSIDVPMSAQIPALYVNNLYEPTYDEWLAENKAQNSGTAVVGFEFIGKGTLAQPFTDTRVFTLNSPLTSPTITSNSAIQNALDGDEVYSYVGSGNKLNPEKSGQRVIIQNNSSSYIFTNTFNYTNLDLRIQGNVLATTSEYLINMDDTTSFDSTSSLIKITVEDGGLLTANNSLGFNNSGNTNNTNTYLTGRTVSLMTLGSARIDFSYNGVDVLTRYVFNGNGNNNDGNIHFVVNAEIVAYYQGVYFSKNKNKIDFYKQSCSGFFNGSCNTSLKAFHSTGGQIRFYEQGGLSVSSDVSGRDYGITFEPEDDGIGYCSFEINSSIIGYACNYLFVKLNNEHVDLKIRNTLGSGGTTFPLGSNTVVNGLFENLGVDKWKIEFKNNNFTFTGINFDKVDLTNANNISTINFIGSSLIETLVIYDSKASALSGGLSKNSKFLKRVTVNADDLVAGVEYKVATSGSPSLGTVGNWFTATGSETGTGTAYFESIELT